MDWMQTVDAYCERTGPDFWSEPVNAVTNAAFLVAALVMAARVRAPGMGIGRALVAVLAAIGVGSFLFHTHARAWAGLADVVPILLFILLYVFAASRDFLGWSARWALAATAGFLPYAALSVPAFSLIPGMGSSAGYAPVPLLILVYALVLRRRAPATARGLALGAGLLCLSLLARTLDGPLCPVLPTGTHFAWHLLNAVMLGWMIEVWRRHVLAEAGRRR